MSKATRNKSNTRSSILLEDASEETKANVEDKEIRWENTRRMNAPLLSRFKSASFVRSLKSQKILDNDVTVNDLNITKGTVSHNTLLVAQSVYNLISRILYANNH